MTRDKKILYITTISLLVLLLFCLFVPSNSSRLIAAPLLLLACGIVHYLIKKRALFSFIKGQVALVMGIIGVIYVAFFYILGLYFEFRYTYHSLFSSFWKFILPITIIIISIEIIRSILLAQGSKLVNVLSYFACVLAEISISYSLSSIGTFNRLISFSSPLAGIIDILGLTLIPALVSNLLYHFLSKRFGALPNIIYRIIITLFAYIFPIMPNMADSVYALYKILLPIIIFWFVSALYEKKVRYAKKKTSRKATAIITVVASLVMISIVMLISCQFKYRVLVIATDSMTGELNKGDAVLYEAYDGQHIYEG